jgi:chromosome partitioning protein
MIISIAATSNGIEKSIFACNLAAQRTRAGHRTLLIDGDSQKSTMLWSIERCEAGIRPQQPTRAVTAKGLLPELENLLPRYKDIVIDAETRDCLASRSALVAARKLVVLVQHRDFDAGRQEAIFKQIEAARLCNPGLQVRFVIIAGAGDVPEQSVMAVRAVVARIPAASLSSTIIHPTPALRDAFSTGMSIPEFFCSDDIAHKEMEKLYREVFEH